MHYHGKKEFSEQETNISGKSPKKGFPLQA